MPPTVSLWSPICVVAILLPTAAIASELSFDDRVRCQTAIERVYWTHQLGRTKSFEAAVPASVIEQKVRTYLGRSAAIETLGKAPITPEMLAREVERMAVGTRMPARLRALFQALGDDPLLIEECLARPALVDRLTRGVPDDGGSLRPETPPVRAPASVSPDWFLRVKSALAAPNALACAAEVWDNGGLDDVSLTGTPSPRYSHSSVWTGNYVIVWGGHGSQVALDTGARYDPVTDTWTPTSMIGAPPPRWEHTAVWTGSEMIVWGGSPPTATGGRYDPVADTWSLTSSADAPSPRVAHSAVWTGSRMIVWGGSDGSSALGDGASYDPQSNTWIPLATAGAPEARSFHTAVWTGSRMIVWGGKSDSSALKTGALYDPATNIWEAPTSTIAPPARAWHTAVWTGTEMIVWGGKDGIPYRGGGRYNPATDTWVGTSTPNSPTGRYGHTAVWTGSRMIVWGGQTLQGSAGDGASYDPATNVWTTMSGTQAPMPRVEHSASWTGASMVVWGGVGAVVENDGGRYVLDAALDDDADGFTACAGDCNDGNAAVHPGTAEACDALDNDCDGLVDEDFPVPGAVSGLRFDPDRITFRWSPEPAADAYDALVGSLDALRGGNLAAAVSACVESGGVDTESAHPDVPGTGHGFFYLTRAHAACRKGSYDTGSAGESDRDAAIATSLNRCP